ncbi:MAG: hypothetical protein ACYC0B_02150 [Gemmatimonadaceae bacterium]
MAKDARSSNAYRSLQANAVAQEFDNGYLRIYSAPTTRPAGPDTAITDQVLLAELRFAADAVASEANGVLTFAAITADPAANATGEAAFARALKADGVTALRDYSVGTADANVILPTLSIVAATEVAVSSMTETVAAASAQ